MTLSKVNEVWWIAHSEQIRFLPLFLVHYDDAILRFGFQYPELEISPEIPELGTNEIQKYLNSDLNLKFV